MTTPPTPRVFLIEENHRYDLTSLSKFGTPVFLCKERECSPFHPERTIEMIRQRLDEAEFHEEEDFICMTGQNLKIAFLLAVAANDFGVVRLLMFDAVAHAYKEGIFDLRTAEELRVAWPEKVFPHEK